MKRIIFLILMLNSFFCMAQGYTEDDYYYQQVGKSADPYVLSEAIAYFEERISAFEEKYQEELNLIENTILSSYQHEFDALNELQPEIWETDADFEKRIRLLRGEIQKRLETEITLKKLDKQLDYEKRFIDLVINYGLALTKLEETAYSITGEDVTITPGEYIREDNLWYVSIAGTTQWGDELTKTLAIDFSRKENKQNAITAFDKAIKDDALAATIVWNAVRDSSRDKDFSCIIHNVYLYHKDTFYPFYIEENKEIVGSTSEPASGFKLEPTAEDLELISRFFSSDKKTKYKDGKYSSEADEFSDSGWKSTIEITVSRGFITDVNWDAVNEDGESKKAQSESGEYGMVAKGGAQAEWHEQAVTMEQTLLEVQDPAAILMTDGYPDDIAGVSIHVTDFVNLAAEALEEAK